LWEGRQQQSILCFETNYFLYTSYQLILFFSWNTPHWGAKSSSYLLLVSLWSSDLARCFGLNFSQFLVHLFESLQSLVRLFVLQVFKFLFRSFACGTQGRVYFAGGLFRAGRCRHFWRAALFPTESCTFLISTVLNWGRALSFSTHSLLLIESIVDTGSNLVGAAARTWVLLANRKRPKLIMRALVVVERLVEDLLGSCLIDPSRSSLSSHLRFGARLRSFCEVVQRAAADPSTAFHTATSLLSGSWRFSYVLLGHVNRGWLCCFQMSRSFVGWKCPLLASFFCNSLRSAILQTFVLGAVAYVMVFIFNHRGCRSSLGCE